MVSIIFFFCVPLAAAFTIHSTSPCIACQASRQILPPHTATPAVSVNFLRKKLLRRANIGRFNLYVHVYMCVMLTIPAFSCLNSPTGTYQPDTTNATECYSCPPGKHQPATGQSQCLSCDNGTFSQLGASNCQACDRFVIIFWQSQSHTLPSNVMSTCFISAVAR